MKANISLFILLFLAPVCACNQAFFPAKIQQYPFFSVESGISLKVRDGSSHLSAPYAGQYGTIHLINPFSGGETKDRRKSWKWIGFGTLQAAAWAAVFHCGAPKLSVPVLLAASYVFLF